MSVLVHIVVGAGVPTLVGSLSGLVQAAIFTLVGAALSALIGLWLHVSGKADELRKRREEQTAGEEGEARGKQDEEAKPAEEPWFENWPAKRSWSGARRGTKQAVATPSPSEADVWPGHGAPIPPQPKPDGPLVAALKSLLIVIEEFGKALRNLVALILMVPVMPVLYVVLITGLLFWLTPLTLSLGFSQQTANGARLADFVLIACSAGWALMSTRVRRRSITFRLLETATFVLLIIATVTAGGLTGNALYGAGAFLFGAWIYFKLFP